MSASVRSSFPAPCTAWRLICTRSSSPPPEPVPADPASAEEAASQAEASPEAASVAAAAAPSRCATLIERCLVLKTRTLVPISYRCHPERSQVIREANGLAESKDPMPACTTCGLPRSFYHGPRVPATTWPLDNGRH